MSSSEPQTQTNLPSPEEELIIFYGDENIEPNLLPTERISFTIPPKPEALQLFAEKKEELRKNPKQDHEIKLADGQKLSGKKVFRYFSSRTGEIWKPTLAGQSIKEEITQPDFLLTDKYQAYSSELLRLSLAGIAVFGFLIQYLKLTDSILEVRGLAWLSVVSLGVSAGFALRHRYFSTDSMAYAVAHLRAAKLSESGNSTEGGRLLAAEEKFLLAHQSREELENYRSLLKRCHRYLTISMWALIAGIVLLALSFTSILFPANKNPSIPGAETVTIESK